MKARTTHFTIRSQQRGIPPLISDLLEEFGDEEHVGNGCRLCYFSRRSLRSMRSALGSAIVERLQPWRRCYKVVGPDGVAITIGHRYKHLRRS